MKPNVQDFEEYNCAEHHLFLKFPLAKVEIFMVTPVWTQAVGFT
jgi:hypothetical protein